MFGTFFAQFLKAELLNFVLKTDLEKIMDGFLHCYIPVEGIYMDRRMVFRRYYNVPSNILRDTEAPVLRFNLAIHLSLG